MSTLGILGVWVILIGLMLGCDMINARRELINTTTKHPKHTERPAVGVQGEEAK